MKHFGKLFAFAAAASLLATTAFAQNVTGKWNGKIQMTKPPMPANATPEMKKRAETAMAMVSKVNIGLTLNANKTFTVVVTGPPTQGDSQKQTGKWSQSGNVLTLTPDKKSKSDKNDPQKLIIAKDGKTLTMVVPAQAQAQARGMQPKITFKR